MTFKTRGSNVLDKADRRLALLKAIDEQLNLGSGLTVAAYSELIESTRTTLEAYNTLLSQVQESRQRLAQKEAALAELSARMLTGVATRYGKNSIEYAKAGGSNRRRSKASAPATSEPKMATTSVASPLQNAVAIGGNGAMAK